MKSKQFNETYVIDKNRKRGIVATEKRKLPPRKRVSVWTTANGNAYQPSDRYFFFDEKGAKKQVRTSQGLRIDEKSGHLDSFGLKVVPVAKLRTDEAKAIEDGQAFYKQIIKDAEREISKLEKQRVEVKREN